MLSKKMEVDFHKRIAALIPKRKQGYVMGAFREVVLQYEIDQLEERIEKLDNDLIEIGEMLDGC